MAAALTMVRGGLEVILIERGEYVGSKSVGGLMYGTVLNKLIPEAFKKAPIERPVSRRAISYLGDGRNLMLEFGADTWSQPPFNNTYVVNRSQFDRWFAKEAEKEGVSLLEGMLVEDLLYDGDGPAKKARGVRLRSGEEFEASVVILAEGANALVTAKAREALQLGKSEIPQDFGVGVKEIIALPRGRIEDRFDLEPHEGAALDFLGEPFKGTIGGGFIYTAREAIHLGAVVRIESMVHAKRSPNEILDAFKRHPRVRKYVEDGELLEYSAHMLPEGGSRAVGELTGNGVMIVGDAAGLLNASLYKEGTNHAMESGLLAGTAAVEAKKSGDFSRTGLASYEAKMQDSIAMQDLRKYADLPDILSRTPGIFSLYPQKITDLLVDYFTVTEQPKTDIQKQAIKKFMTGLPKLQFVRDLFRARKVL